MSVPDRFPQLLPTEQLPGVLAAAVSSAHDAVVITDADARILFWNAGAERSYGWAAEEMVGRPISDIVPDGRRSEEEQPFAEAAAGVPVEHHRGARRRKDGSVVWVTVTLAPVRADDGTVTGVVSIARDVALSAGAEALTGELLESAPDAMIVVDESGTIVHANRQAYALFGHPTGSLVGRVIEDLVPARFRSRHVGHRRSFSLAPVLRPMGTGAQELIACRADGSEFPVEISLSPVRSWRGNLTSAAIRDATARQQAEEALRNALAREQEATAQLREVDRLKDEFLSTVSHELRTPVTAIGGFAELLEETGDDLSEEQRATLLERIAQNAQEMHLMVEQLLDYSRITGGRVTIETQVVPLVAAVADVVQNHDRAVRHHPVRIEVDPDIQVAVDPVGFGRVIGNFLTNAAKFSPEGTSITISGRVVGDEVHVAVQDEGIGIPEQDLLRIFERFFQASTRTTVRGAGIGLSIAARYAELHGGRVEASSTVGAGSTFTLVLPGGRPAERTA